MTFVTLLAWRRVAPALAFAAAAGGLHAQDAPDPRAVQPERPTVATHAGTVATGILEIETGLELDRVSSNSHSLIAPTEFKFGLARRAQLDVFMPLVRPTGETSGVGDVGAGIKWRLTDDAPVVGNFALLPAVKLPTASAEHGRGTGTTDLSILAISSHMFGPVTMDLNAGYTHRSGDGTVAPRTATVWTVAFGGPAVGAVGWVAEVYAYPATPGASGQHSVTALLAGPTLLARGWLAFDTGVIVPLHGPQPHAFYVGTVYNVGRVGHPAPKGVRPVRPH